VEFNNGQYHYIVTERGFELHKKTTTDPNELLRWLVIDLTRAEAQDYELRHRNNNEDSRRQLFAKHIELLRSIDLAWAEKQKKYYNEILAKYPFNDGKQPKNTLE